MPVGETKATILVADDDLNLRKVVRLFLEMANYSVLEAKNGKEAVDTAVRNEPDAILLDVMMPIMDGFSACTQLKSMPQTQNIPVVMCTARGTKDDLVSALKGGADDYVVKPFKRDILLQKVEKVLKAKIKAETTTIAVTDKRGAQRKTARWSLSWGAKKGEGLLPSYKAKVFNISLKGLAFEFNRCEICTGYEKDSVHMQCLLAPFGQRFKVSHELDLVLSLSPEIIREAKGKIAHIYQPPETPKTEIVGVTFTTRLPEATRETIQQYLEGRLLVAEKV